MAVFCGFEFFAGFCCPPHSPCVAPLCLFRVGLCCVLDAAGILLVCGDALGFLDWAGFVGVGCAAPVIFAFVGFSVGVWWMVRGLSYRWRCLLLVLYVHPPGGFLSASVSCIVSLR